MNYSVRGMKSIVGEFETQGAIVRAFGDRMARHDLGKRGECVVWRVDAACNTAWECSVFIGVKDANSTNWVGRNVSFTIHIG